MAIIQLKTSLLIIGMAIGRKFLYRLFPPAISEWLWLLFAIRLLIPPDIGITVMTVHSQDGFEMNLPDEYAWIRWIGFGISFGIMLWNYIRFHNALRKKTVLQNKYIESWIQKHPSYLRCRIYTSSSAASPMVYGLLFPKIILPVQKYSAVQLDHILLHEWMHIHRWDLWKKAFVMMTTMLNWFNPTCWLMLLLFNLDLELACDADVLRRLSRQEHAIYASVLLDCHNNMNSSEGVETGFLSGILQERIVMIMKHSKMTNKARCIAALFIGVMFLAAFGKCKSTISADVPDLVGKTEQEAKQILQQNGFEFMYSEDF